MLDVNGIESNEFLEYKGRPLVRKDDEIYYGDISSFYVKMMIMNEKIAKNEEKIPVSIVVQLFKPNDKFPVRQIIANGLSDAFETASVWLDRPEKLIK